MKGYREMKRRNFIYIFFLSTTTGDDDGGDEGEEGEEAEEKMPSCGDYVMHFLTIFWKIIFACVPPTGRLPCFLFWFS